jgi:hypothetical protein
VGGEGIQMIRQPPFAEYRYSRLVSLLKTEVGASWALIVPAQLQDELNVYGS